MDILLNSAVYGIKCAWWAFKISIYILTALATIYAIYLLYCFFAYYLPMKKDLKAHPEQREYNNVPTWSESLPKIFTAYNPFGWLITIINLFRESGKKNRGDK